MGDPFTIPKPDRFYAELAREPAPKRRIGVSLKPLMGVEVDTEVAAAVRATATFLADQGHEVIEVDPQFDGLNAVRDFCNIW
ncbi:MAG: amidase, partial [Xanthomonadales bacterium]|nr:amidase [Xanthomonadales bacterium]